MAAFGGGPGGGRGRGRGPGDAGRGRGSGGPPSLFGPSDWNCPMLVFYALAAIKLIQYPV